MVKYNIKRRHSKTLDLSLQKRNKSTVGNIFDGEHNFGATIQPINNFVSNFGDIRRLTPEQAKQAGITPTNNGLAQISKSAGSGFDVSNFMGQAGNVVGGITSIIDSSLKNAQIADTTGIENNIKDLRDTDFSEAIDSNSLMNTYNSIDFLKDDYSWKDVRGVSNSELFGNTLSAIGSGAMAGASVGGPFGAIAGAAIGLGGGLAGIFAGKNKARKKARFLNQAAEAANNMAIDNYDFQVNNVMQNNARNAMQYAYAAEGGPINIKKKNRGKFTASAKRAGMGVQEFARHVLANKDKYSSTLVKRANFARNAAGWKHAPGGPLDSLVTDINSRSKADFVQRLLDPNRAYIKDWESDNIATHKLGWATDDKGAIIFPSVQRINGKLYDFTDPKNNRGKWDALKSAIERRDTLRMTPAQAEEFTKTYKEYYPKGETFKALGGYLKGRYNMLESQTHGGDFSNGVTFINNGGTHEQNPFEGVPMGIAPDGQPNLVEEGEVLYNDYVFSNRLHPTDKELKESNLPKKYKGHTFALIAEDMSKESAERPNDPISKRGLEASLGKLASLQEEQRMKKGKTGTQQMMKFGGRKFAGTKNTYSRYAPAVGSAIGAVQSVFQKPDYTNSDLIFDVVNNLSRNKVSPTLLSDYLSYKPIDRNYYLNQLKGQAGATRRAVMNSGLSSGQRMAGLLAADYNTQQGIADALFKADMYNEQLKQNIAQFNRGTSQYNSGALMQAAAQNAQLAQAKDNMRLSGTTTAANMRELADTALATSRSANLTNFFDNLGAIGRENRDANMLQAMIDSDLFGTLSESMKRGWSKNGGMLTKRSRRRK